VSAALCVRQNSATSRPLSCEASSASTLLCCRERFRARPFRGQCAPSLVPKTRCRREGGRTPVGRRCERGCVPMTRYRREQARRRPVRSRRERARVTATTSFERELRARVLCRDERAPRPRYDVRSARVLCSQCCRDEPARNGGTLGDTNTLPELFDAGELGSVETHGARLCSHTGELGVRSSVDAERARFSWDKPAECVLLQGGADRERRNSFDAGELGSVETHGARLCSHAGELGVRNSVDAERTRFSWDKPAECVLLEGGADRERRNSFDAGELGSVETHGARLCSHTGGLGVRSSVDAERARFSRDEPAECVLLQGGADREQAPQNSRIRPIIGVSLTGPSR
jgi:hypothetical protein